jgi:hypothetical protein
MPARSARRKGPSKGKHDDPGDEKVSDQTRTFELEDEQVFSGAGRGPTPDEAAAAERAAPVTDHTRAAYKEMLDRGAHQRGEGRI